MESDKISENTDDFLATVGDVKEITETAIAEVIDNQNELANGAILNEYQDDAEENTKWLELKKQIQAQSGQLAAMTAILTTTQTTILTAMQGMTELMTIRMPDPKPNLKPETESETESKTEMETRSKELPKSAASELANLVDNPATTAVEAVQSVEKPAAKVRKRF